MKIKKNCLCFCFALLIISCTSNKKSNDLVNKRVENIDSINKSDSINKLDLFDSIMDISFDEFSNTKYVPNSYFRVFKEGYLRIKRSKGVFYIFNLKDSNIEIQNTPKNEEWYKRYNDNIIQLIADENINCELKSKKNVYGLCYIIAKKSYLGRSKIKIFPIYIFTLDEYLNNKVNTENNILKFSKENINIPVSEVYLDSNIDSENDE